MSCPVHPWGAASGGYVTQPPRIPNVLLLGHADLILGIGGLIRSH